MSSSHQELLQSSKQGDAGAIATLINRSLEPKGIIVEVDAKHRCLQIRVKSNRMLDQETIVQFLVRGIKKLDIESVDDLKIFSQSSGQRLPDWIQEISLRDKPQRSPTEEVKLTPTPFTAQKSQRSSHASPETRRKSIPNLDSRVSQIKADENFGNKAKSMAFSVSNSIWKWYVSGFKSRPDLPLYLSPRLYRIILTLFVFIWITAPFGWYERTEPQTASSEVPRPDTLKPGCERAIGRLWTNVRLYRDPACNQPFATVFGGGRLRDGERGVLIQFDTGENEWKTRRAVDTQSYVRTDDPASSARLWREIDQ